MKILDRSADCRLQTLQTSAIPAMPKGIAYAGLRKQLIALVSVQLLFLAALAVPKAWTLSHGRVINLKATIVDPFDPLRGEYEELTFTNASEVVVSKSLKKDTVVYVIFSKSTDGTWKETGVSLNKPARQTDKVAIRATTNTAAYTKGNKYLVPVAYGFERFYVPEGTSNKIGSTTENPFTAEIAVDDSGNAFIKTVSQKGQLLFDVMNLQHPYTAKL